MLSKNREIPAQPREIRVSNSNIGRQSGFDSDTGALHAVQRVTCTGPRRLTATGIALLRQSKGEFSRRVRQ